MAEEQTNATSDSGTRKQFFYDDAPVPRALKAIGRRLKKKNSEPPGGSGPQKSDTAMVSTEDFDSTMESMESTEVK